MDRTLDKAAHVVLADLAENGGGTYEAGTLIPFRPDHGYAVGISGLHLPAKDVDSEAVAWALRAVTTEFEASYGGTWLSDGLVYFDAVQYFVDRDNAILQGRLSGQQAIYDFGAKEAISL